MSKALLIAAVFLNFFIAVMSEGETTPAAAGAGAGAAGGVDYCKIDCKGVPNSACDCSTDEVACGGPPKVLTPDDTMRAYIVDLHNEYREKIASGEEKRSGNVGATDMKVMEYDKDLEHVAECYNKKCNGEHDKCRLTDKFKADELQVGQNMYGGYEEPCDKRAINSSLYYWYYEVNETDRACVMNFDKCDMHRVGHFTQMVWAITTHVGCSLVEFKGTSPPLRTCHVFCDYGPSGNWGAKRIYTLGPPARDCKGTHAKFKHLCIGEVVSGEHDAAPSEHKTLGYFLTGVLTFLAIVYHRNLDSCQC